MKVYQITDPEFAKYGRIISGYDFSGLIRKLKELPMSDGVTYVAADPALESLPVFKEFQEGFYGEIPAELGYCLGHNDALNGLEYHRGSEVNISASDFVVMVGCQQDLEEGFCYDTSKVQAFYVPEGLAVEFYATTLHYCACNVTEDGYRHGTFLPRGTNTPLDAGFQAKTEEDKLLQAKNKWLIAHPDGGQAEQVPKTMYGKNWTIKDCEGIS
ncbi:DUF4867 family protein [Clostridium sp. OF09-36]|uniref:DUF4867 family protein n=1 Tax=Clostridium sp. OF09-36 TaxID=2292310 RepID=UPI000E484AA1|nr:DUF4867 family protein [Clostridium sp. OF09-36]RHV88962.1 DUF4867 family protein [Clostridium sp. OF09-36]